MYMEQKYEYYKKQLASKLLIFYFMLKDHSSSHPTPPHLMAHRSINGQVAYELA